jgi:pyruvate dehydrogenase E2 component (dihydrolipoamide acetyltransferase)
MADFCMPSLGADMKKGILVEWKVEPGDCVKRGDIIAEVETEKAAIEIEVFVDGIIDKLLIQEGEEVPVGTVMAIIRTEETPVVENKPATDLLEAPSQADQSIEPANASTEEIAARQANQPAAKAKEVSSPESGHVKRYKASPAARKKAAALGVDLSKVQGTGPHGTINIADVEKTAAVGKPAGKTNAWAIPPALEGNKFQLGMRRAIATAMTLSNREIPHYYLKTRIDLRGAANWLTEENQRRTVKNRLLPVVLLLKATALALAEIPALNGYWLEDRHQPSEAVHIGFAIALRQGGLIAPAIHHANQKSLDDLMADMMDLINRTRAGRLRSSEMTDATVTLTNLGDLGVESAFGLIYPPQLALVSFGRIMDQPWIENGEIVIRPVVSATLAGDHRATDGRTGAQFLNALNRYLQEKEKL